MTDYKNTLNLPKTAFPMKANLANREPDRLKHWAELDIYDQLRVQRQGHDQFILHDGPPYANGKIHLGHAVNKVLKDIVIKSQSLNGFDVPYVPGWDCHGLPIELNVEKKIGKAGHKVTAEEFRLACRKYAQGQVDAQRNEFKRLGILGEWDNPYLTMSYDFEAGVIRALAKVYANGHIMRSFKPVYWCTDCGSALAEAEVEYQDKTSPAIDVRFDVVDANELAKRFACQQVLSAHPAVVIWTTTPWTLPANEAVAVHPELEYSLVRYRQEAVAEDCVVLASALVESVMQRFASTDYEVLATCSGEQLAGLTLQHPFLAEKQVPLVLGDHVTTETGTGCVHTAPGHGQEDYLVGLQNDLPITNPVDGRGCFHSDVAFFAGEHISKANPQVVAKLKELGTLLHEEKLTHSYPHCWRHKIPLLFRATPQWFISMEKKGLRRLALDEVTKTEWIPGWGETRIRAMLENHPGWCISRQRAWGVPIPVFVHSETGEPHPKTVALMEQVAKAVEEQGIEAWYQLSKEELLGSDADLYEKSNDVLDVWFDSGVTHYTVLEQRDYLRSPADLYLEGSDQHRGWFQTSLLTCCAINNRAPFKQVLTHGFTVDANGKKMSKSIGNTIEPEKVMKTLGADILRLWIATADYRSDMALSDEILKRVTDQYRRLRNTSRFLLANLHDFDPAKHCVVGDKLLALDKWLVRRAMQLQAEVIDAYNRYEFHVVCQKVHHFCSVELGSFYLDIIKDRQYTCPTESLARRSAQTALYHVIEAMVCWLAPILSFTADELWGYLPGHRSASVLLTEWYEQFPVVPEDDFSVDYWPRLIEVRNEVNKAVEALRAAGELGSSLEAEVTIYASDEWYRDLLHLGDELRFVLITSSAEVKYFESLEGGLPVALPGLALKVTASSYEKCERCWHRREEVGQLDQPELCSRCVSNVFGDGEVRLYA